MALVAGQGRRSESVRDRFKSCHPDPWLKGPDLRERVQGPSAIPASGMIGVGAQRENVADSRWRRRFHVDTGLRFADRLEDPKPPSGQSFASGRFHHDERSSFEVLLASRRRASATGTPCGASPHLLGTHPLPGMATSVPHQPQATHLPGRAWSTPSASSEPSFRSACGRSSLACAAVIHHTSDRIHVVTTT